MRLLPITCAVVLFSLPALSQERCATDAKKRFGEWRAENAKLLDELSAQCEQLQKECYKTKVNYNGMEMPLAAALIIEGERYGELADVRITQVAGETQDCMGETTVVRGVYDFAREVLGITTVLPEHATRIDFEELRQGNLFGGDKSIINEAGRTIDEIFNPFRW